MNQKDEILQKLSDEYQRWESLLSGLSERQIIDPDLLSYGLSVKDIIAHLWAWQQRSVARLEAAVGEREPLLPAWPEELDPASEEDLDQINAWIYTTNRDKPWQQVYTEWRADFQLCIALGQQIPEANLLEVGHYAWLPAHPLIAVLEGVYSHHHEEHLEPLLAELE